MILIYENQSKGKWNIDVKKGSDSNNIWLVYQFAYFCLENTIQMSIHTFNSSHNKKQLNYLKKNTGRDN